ncbi:MAG: molybdopterin-dependent oxidoreductase [Kofleriaceae bacterium]|nr:molybdopterin-dependent oxidoreductase [Kofleriaceae bacterium]
MMATLDGGIMRIAGSMQCPYYVHKAMKVLLGCDAEQVVVTQTVTGGGFGGKEEYPSMLAAHCALLAQASGAPVKMVYDRDEDIAATTKRHPSRVHHRLGLRADGTIAAIDVDVIFDGGAYLTLSPVVLSRGVLHAAGPYRCDVVRVRGRAVATNHPPHGAFRGFGAPQTTFAYERQLAKAARVLGVAPWDHRDRLALRPGDTTATGQVLERSVGTDDVLRAIREAAGPPPTREGTNRHGAPVRRGRGHAFYFHAAPASPARASSAWPGGPRSWRGPTAPSRSWPAPPTWVRGRSRSSPSSPPRRWACRPSWCGCPIRPPITSPTAAPPSPAAPAWWWAASSTAPPARCACASRRGPTPPGSRATSRPARRR